MAINNLWSCTLSSKLFEGILNLAHQSLSRNKRPRTRAAFLFCG